MTAPPTRLRRRLTSAATALACVALVGAQGLFLYGSSGRDDSHITYWAARSLAERGEIVNYDGRAVEQSSSLLHVVALAALYRISGVPLATLGGLFAVVAAGLTAWAAWRLARGLGLSRAPLAALVCAVSPQLVYWAFGGLDTSLAALTAVLAAGATGRLVEGGLDVRRGAAAAAALLAYVAARPEGIFVLLLLLGILAGYLRTWTPWTRMDSMDAIHGTSMSSTSSMSSIRLAALAFAGAAALGSFAAVTLFRYAAFGQAFPQPVYAKAAGLGPRQLVLGGLYLVGHGWTVSLVAAAGLGLWAVGDAVRRRSNTATALVAAAGFVAAEAAFAVASGGDWMEAGRFLVPAVGPLAVLAAAGLERIPGRAAVAAAAALVACSAVDSLKLAMDESTGMPIAGAAAVYRPVLARLDPPPPELSFFEYANRIHLRDLPVAAELERTVGKILAERPGPVRVMSSQMGMVAYRLASRYFRDVELIDMNGLTTTHFADCPVTRGLPRTRLGIALTYGYFFAHLDRIESECGVGPPDVVYTPIAPGSDLPALLEAHGYRVFYRQTGTVGGAGLGGTEVPADQILAARAELAPLLDPDGPRVFTFP